MTYPLDAIRDQFPALRIEDSGIERVYFDNPAGTQVSQGVVDRMNKCLIETNANMAGHFVTSRRADAVIAEAHQAMADFLNASSADEIVFGQNMTSLTLHISRSIGRTLTAGDEIIVSRMCHDANVAPWTLLAEDVGATVRWLPFNTETFEFEMSALENLLTERTKLVCVGGASNLTGTINDIATICRLAKQAGALTYIDAVQLAPHAAIDVQALDCDFLACSAYKFFGPHQGILYGRQELLESLTPYKVRPAPDEPPFCFETGTQSHEGLAGTTAAVDYFATIGETCAIDYHAGNAAYPTRRKFLRSALQFLFDYEKQLASHLLEGLSTLPGVRIHGLTGKESLDRRVPTVAFTAKGAIPEDIAKALGERNIFVWSGHNYAVEVAKSLGIYNAGGAVRIGPVHYNSVAEVDRLIAALEEILPSARAA
jgi:cysteine desulfurase family protein (TIGR01976 family)